MHHKNNTKVYENIFVSLHCKLHTCLQIYHLRSTNVITRVEKFYSTPFLTQKNGKRTKWAAISEGKFNSTPT